MPGVRTRTAPSHSNKKTFLHTRHHFSRASRPPPRLECGQAGCDAAV